MIMIIDQSGTVLKLRTGMMTEILPGNTIATSSVACQAALLAGHANVGLDHVSPAMLAPSMLASYNAGPVKIVGLCPCSPNQCWPRRVSYLPPFLCVTIGTDLVSAFFYNQLMIKKAFR